MLTNIRKRQHELNTSYKSNGSFARLYDMVYETHDMNKADMLFKNILEVDSNHDMAIMKSLDLLVELYNYVPPAEVNRERQKVLESITKVRDASQFKAYLQRKMALHKGRLKNKIHIAVLFDEGSEFIQLFFELGIALGLGIAFFIIVYEAVLIGKFQVHVGDSCYHRNLYKVFNHLDAGI